MQDIGGFNRGYERLRAQNFEKRTKGDLKEGFYLGKNLPLEDPNVVARKFGQGPNKYPEELDDPAKFRNVADDYHSALTSLAMGILQMLARTLDLEDDAFNEFCQHPVAVLRLLHYPPQEPDASELERGKLLALHHAALLLICPRNRCPYRFRRHNDLAARHYRRLTSVAQHFFRMD